MPMKMMPTLRQRLKQSTRQQLEQAAMKLLARQGYRETSVDQIVKLAGTTRTTFYDHFVGKSDLIKVLQDREIAPALMALCERLDAHDPITRRALRDWLDEYAVTWSRIRVFFDAYSDASRSDAAVAATLLPNSYAVTSRMVRFLGHFKAAAREAAHYKLVLLFNDLDQLMYVSSLMREPQDVERMFEAFTDLYWSGLFDPALRRRQGSRGATNPGGRRRSSRERA